MDFVCRNPGVVIDENSTSILEIIRLDFYRLFDTVRTSFIKEKSPDLLNESEALSENYIKAEKEVIETLGVDAVLMEAGLGKFLHNPVDGLMRGLFDPLFDLLKNKVDIEAFEQESSRNIEEAYNDFYRLGYEKWLQLSLIKLLEVDTLFEITLPKPTSKEIIKRSPTSEPVPSPTKTTHLSFKNEPSPILIVPDFIIHSDKMNKYVAMRSGFKGAFWTASHSSENREWYPIESMLELDPGVILIYVADSPEEISLIADIEKICRPDLIVVCRERRNWYENEGLEKVKRSDDNLKPKLGTYIISRENVAEENASESIHLLPLGFDQTKLSTVIDVLYQFCMF